MFILQIVHLFIRQTIRVQIKVVVLLTLLCVCSQPLLATEMTRAANNSPSLYTVEVLVVDESADTRWRVFKEGLDEVFIRIAGDSIVMDKLKRPAASRYVKQYSYDPVDPPVIGEEGEILSHRLKIQYNGSAMVKYLRNKGFPVWGEHRADVVIWLAIRDGRNEYVLKDADESLLKSSAEQALHRRGIPYRWPIFDLKDQKILKVSDIRGGFEKPIMAASKRYSRGPALAGSLMWNGTVWQSSWSLLMASGDKHWSIEDADYNKLLNRAIDQAADAMGVVFAIRGISENQQLAMVQLQVQAVYSINQYRKLENYLRGLSAVEKAMPIIVDGQSATFEITLRSKQDDFLNLIKNDAELIEAQPLAPVFTSPVITDLITSVVISEDTNNAGAVPGSDTGVVSNQQVPSQQILGKQTSGQAELQHPTTGQVSVDSGSMDQASMNQANIKPAVTIPLFHFKLNSQ